MFSIDIGNNAFLNIFWNVNLLPFCCLVNTFPHKSSHIGLFYWLIFVIFTPVSGDHDLTTDHWVIMTHLCPILTKGLLWLQPKFFSILRENVTFFGSLKGLTVPIWPEDVEAWIFVDNIRPSRKLAHTFMTVLHMFLALVKSR